MDLLSAINERARSNFKNNNVKIGIGLGDNRERIEESLETASENRFAEVIIFYSADELLTALYSNKINGAVRGTLNAYEIVTNLRSIFKIDQLMRLACLKLPLVDKYIFVAPVGIDEGSNVEEKLELIKAGNEFIKRLNIDPSIGILTSGRFEDRDRSPRIANTMEDADKLVELAQKNNIKVDNFGILIEDAVDKCNFILMPDGVSGNLVFRTLYFLGGAAAIGAPVLNLDKIFIDTSRAKKSYVESIAFAAALVD